MRKVYIKEVEAKSSELVHYSKDVVAPKMENLKKIADGLIWEGRSKESYLKGYNARVDKLLELNNKISKLAEFLLVAAEGYSNANNKIGNAYEELLLLLQDKKV